MTVGIDILDVCRMEKMALNMPHMKKVYTKYELEYINKTNQKTQRMAGIYCAKEAFLKAIGVGIKNGINLLEIEVKHEESGKPYLSVSERVKNLLLTKNLKEISISISHTESISTAICILS